jgi:formylglycine-generating enzyme required for sulfatase activity
LGEYAWLSGNGGSETHPVGTKKPNAWGLYDMHGNVWEWCADWCLLYPADAQVDPAGPSSGSWRVLRGGLWGSVPSGCRSAGRYLNSPGRRCNYFGFRYSAGT